MTSGFPRTHSSSPPEPEKKRDPTTPALKWAFIAGHMLAMTFFSAGGSLLVLYGVGDDVTDITATLLLGIGSALALGKYVAALLWVHASWSMLPSWERRNRKGKVFTPARAVAWLLVPGFNVYWIFAMPVAYCDALDRILLGAGSFRVAPRGLAIASAILTLMPYVNLLLAPVFWFFFMLGADEAKREVLAVQTSRKGRGYGA